MRYIIANWKAHKTRETATSWITEFNSQLDQEQVTKGKLETGELEVIIAPPAPLLSVVSSLIADRRGLAVCAQDVSEFDSGSYTGQVVAENLVGVARYALVGHSETRKYGGVSEEVIAKKIAILKKYDLSPILCMEEGQTLHPDIALLAYEQSQAIGTGKSTPLPTVLEFKKSLNLPSSTPFLYGASVDNQSIKEYLLSPEIAGFLVGGASLDPKSFFQILQNL